MELSCGPYIEQKSRSTQASDGLRAYRSLYEQLPVNESRTRVFLLHSHSSNAAPVSCSLEVMRFDPEPSRAYTALSYVWGDASVTEDIIVNGVSFAVTSNLASALRQIRKGFGKVLLWVDAISINQRDILERNQQVLLMKTIYSKAERVIGWLGPDEDGGSQALKTFETLFRNAILYPDDFEWVRRMPELLTVNGKYSGDSGKKFESNDTLEKLLLLLKRPFWRRIWIVQELVLPSNLRLLYGEEFTDMPEPDSFYNIVIKLAKINNGRPSSLPIELLARFHQCVHFLRLLASLRFWRLHPEYRVNRKWKGVSGFIHTRILLEFHKTSDPRDHVYGLLGLNDDLGIVPDYSDVVTVADVYLEMARHCLKTESLDSLTPDILSFAGTRHSCNGPDYSTYLDLPSWVPDWRFQVPARVRHRRYPQSHAFKSNGRLQMQVFDRKWLRGSAVVWDTVSRTEYKTGFDFQDGDWAEKIDIEKPDDWTYPSGISRFKAIVILWLGGFDGSKSSICDLQIDSELFQSYEMTLYCNIAKHWADKHGWNEKPKLTRFIFGRNGLPIVPNTVPMGHRESYVTKSMQIRYDLKVFHAERGYIGLGPLATKVGDLVCVLEGHKVPVILHRRGSHYIFIGDCDVVGIMNGEVLEAVERGEAEITEIEIR